MIPTRAGITNNRPSAATDDRQPNDSVRYRMAKTNLSDYREDGKRRDIIFMHRGYTFRACHNIDNLASGSRFYMSYNVKRNGKQVPAAEEDCSTFRDIAEIRKYISLITAMLKERGK